MKPKRNKGIELASVFNSIANLILFIYKLVKDLGGFFVVKQFFGFLIAMFIGDKSLILINSIALSVYTSSYGIRYASEDVPYIQPINTLFKVLLPFILGVIYFLIFSSLKLLDRESDKEPRVIGLIRRFTNIKAAIKMKDSVKNLRKVAEENSVSIKTIIAILLTFSIGFGFVIYLLLAIYDTQSAIWISLAGTIACILIFLINWDKKFFWYIPAVGTVGIYVLASIFLLYPPNYARILRLTKHGGGIPASIQIINQSGSQETTNYDGFLLLKTNEAYIMFDTKNQKIDEIKLTSVQSFSYKYQNDDHHNFLLPGNKLSE